ncbi:helix-turn-helix domain-containing protein [Xanthomonas campestris]|uniref:helix-turn-helix domain-containing protein n=1 Tax=Xanthomonas campestris TaxID=339 RepID=UPI003561B78E
MTPRSRGLGGHCPQHVQALLDQGLTQRALAQRVGVTHQAVSRFVRRHGLLSWGLQAYRSRQADQVAQRRRQVRQLLKEGRTSAEVAARLGVSIATVSLDRRALGVGRACKGAEGRTLRGAGLRPGPDALEGHQQGSVGSGAGGSSSAVYRFCRHADLHARLDRNRTASACSTVPARKA